MARIKCATGEYYHVFNRGVEKRRIFNDDKDRHRFVHDLYEFNDRDAVLNVFRNKTDGGEASISLLGERWRGKRGPEPQLKKRKLLVDIIAWTFMPNHYHLLLRQRVYDGISKFMHKLGTGYTLYFNQRHKRSGVLFQGPFKAKHVHDDRYLRQLLGYIHANPIELSYPNWRDKTGPIVPASSVLKVLEDYRWSSYLDYQGEKNIPSLLNGERIDDLGLPRGEAHRRLLQAWISEYSRQVRLLGDLTIET